MMKTMEAVVTVALVIVISQKAIRTTRMMRMTLKWSLTREVCTH